MRRRILFQLKKQILFGENINCLWQNQRNDKGMQERSQ